MEVDIELSFKEVDFELSFKKVIVRTKRGAKISRHLNTLRSRITFCTLDKVCKKVYPLTLGILTPNFDFRSESSF